MAGSQLTTVLDHIRRLVAPLPTPLSDHDLLQRFVRSRDEAAFAELMERHARMVLSVCRRVLAHSQDAEDACQVAFLVLARRASEVRGSVGGWLHAVAWRTAQRLKAQRARRPAEDLASVDAAQPDTTAEVTWREVRLVLDEELQRMPDKYRAPLVLCYLDGMTQDEAAHRLGWPCGVLRGRLDRGRERLRARLIRRGLGLSAALFGAGLAESAFAEIVPATVSSGIVRGALLVAAGQAAAPSAVSAKVVALAGEVTRTMIAMKVRSVALTLAALAVVVVGASYSLLRLMADDPAMPAAAPVALAQVDEKPKPKPAADTVADVSRARIEGVVVDERGKPVAGAVVATSGGRSGLAMRTAADGSFRLVLDEASVSHETVTASADNGAQQGIGSIQDAARSQVAKLRIVVKPARTIDVRVTDAAKKPVDDAAVGILYYGMLLAHGQTDASGAAALRFPADSFVLQVVALKPGVGFDYFENFRKWPINVVGPPPKHVTLTLDGARSIAVQAVDSANKPVAGIELVPSAIQKRGRLESIDLSGAAELKYVSARTKGDGLAAFDWIPVAREGWITFLNEGAEYSLPDAPHLKSSDPKNMLTARLQRNVPISGKVTLPGGKPAAGVLLQAEGRGDENHSFRGIVRTGADGNYKLFVSSNQSYIVGVTDAEWAAPSRTDIVLREGEPRKDLDFRLNRGIVIRGKVTIGADKKAAAKHTITLVEEGSDIASDLGDQREARKTLSRWAVTDNDGQYTIRVEPGRYRLWPVAASTGSRLGEKEITLKADKETVEHDFHLDQPNRGVLKGVVLADAFDGKPVAGAVIHGQGTKSGQSLGQAVADDEGRFELNRIPDESFVYACNRERTMATISRILAADDEVKIVISRAGKLRGRLVDKAGKAEAGVRIWCDMRFGPEKKPELRANLFAETDDAGRFEFHGIVAGARCMVFNVTQEGLQTFRTLPQVQAETVDLGDLTFDRRKE